MDSPLETVVVDWTHVREIKLLGAVWTPEKLYSVEYFQAISHQ